MLITPHAMISRAVAGIRRRSLIINLPGSPKGAKENLAVILPALKHAIEKIKGDDRDCAYLCSNSAFNIFMDDGNLC